MAYRKIFADHWDDTDLPEDPDERLMEEMDGRDVIQEIIEWLPSQPQDVWLGLARAPNWDNADDLLLWMVNQPQCDLSVAALILWGSDVVHYLREGGLREGTHTHAILTNYEKGFYRTCELALDRMEMIEGPMNYLRYLRDVGGDLPFRVPRAFFGPFEGREPREVTNIEPLAFETLTYYFHPRWGSGSFLKTPEEHRKHVESRTSHIRPHLTLPPLAPGFRDSHAHLSDEDYIEALYGTFENYLAACNGGKLPRRPIFIDRSAYSESFDLNKHPILLWTLVSLLAAAGIYANYLN